MSAQYVTMGINESQTFSAYAFSNTEGAPVYSGPTKDSKINGYVVKGEKLLVLPSTNAFNEILVLFPNKVLHGFMEPKYFLG